ncbi:MAG: hypothetical protein BWY70_00555 [Bacteroidetes bacterium ADurb.Bin408]|nr:MAG: hypothetical protein BWY70_00555 [Bacteroidetes bacterium ADurb.Bin408]
MKRFKYILSFIFLFLCGCKAIKTDGWAVDFRYELDKERYGKIGHGSGWASNFKSSLNPLRFNSPDGWAANFKPHYNVDRYCRNNGWAVDFRSSLSPERFNIFNSSFYVMPAPSYTPLKFNDSFGSVAKSKEGAFAFSKKKKTVTEKSSFRFRKKPRTSDSFGPNVEKKEYKTHVYDKKKKRVVKRKGLFKRKREKPYKRKENMELDLFEFKP